MKVRRISNPQTQPCAPTPTLILTALPRRYSVASDRLSSAPEWRALDRNSDEREELYEEFCSSLARREEAERKAAREAKLAGARKLFLKEGVGIEAQWRKVRAIDKIRL